MKLWDGVMEHYFFIDLEKAYEKQLSNAMWWVLCKHKFSTNYVSLIKDMYNNVMTSIRTIDGIGRFSIRLHQGPSLKTCLLALVMDEITIHTRRYPLVYSFCLWM